MKKYDAVVFDLDGTLLDTIDDLADCVNLALSEEGFACRTVSEVKSFVGNGIVKLIDRSVPEGTSEEEKSRALESFKRHYAVGCENKTKPYDGILKLLDDLRGKGFKIAVVSNKIDSAVSVLCEKYFGGRIDFCVGDREGFARKPAPDAVLEALKKISSAPERAVYIGDSDVDIKTAENAGMACISVSWGFRSRDFLLLNGASVIADKPSDIYKILSNT
mgnify:FL=1|jgi:HAD hydrolase, family IA, variant 3